MKAIEIEQTTVVHVDSRDRDTAAYPSALNYKINLADLECGPLRNVKSVELIAVAFPRIENEDWVSMHIEELGNRVDSTDTNASRSFGILYFDNYNLPKGEVKAMKGADFERKIVEFAAPLANLSWLSIRFRKHGGEIQAADITPAGGLGSKELGQHSIVLRITTIHRTY